MGLARARPWMSRIARMLAALGLRSAGNARDPLGDAGERAAARHLTRAGYRVIGRNLRVPMGGADILALAPDGETVVVVEVKARRVAAVDAAPGAFVARPPEGSIPAHKREKLVAIL